MKIILEDANMIGDTIEVGASSELEVLTKDRILLVTLPPYGRAALAWMPFGDKCSWQLKVTVLA